MFTIKYIAPQSNKSDQDEMWKNLYKLYISSLLCEKLLGINILYTLTLLVK